MQNKVFAGHAACLIRADSIPDKIPLDKVLESDPASNGTCDNVEHTAQIEIDEVLSLNPTALLPGALPGDVQKLMDKTTKAESHRLCPLNFSEISSAETVLKSQAKDIKQNLSPQDKCPNTADIDIPEQIFTDKKCVEADKKAGDWIAEFFLKMNTEGKSLDSKRPDKCSSQFTVSSNSKKNAQGQCENKVQIKVHFIDDYSFHHIIYARVDSKISVQRTWRCEPRQSN